MSIRVLQGDNREVLKTLPADSVHTVVTSPPYWGLRDYRVPGQIGLEDSPQAYVANILSVFAELHRVLRPDGTVWLNLGDSYASYRDQKQVPQTIGAEGLSYPGHEGASNRDPSKLRAAGLKHKDLVGIPWRVALALQAAGWWLRQDIIWAKPNPMPESVTDRCTKAHEYIFLLAKAERYYYDSAAIAEPAIHAGETVALGEKSLSRGQASGMNVAPSGNANANVVLVGETRNKRSVWNVTTKAYNEAHFATFPTDLIEPCILAGAPVGGLVLDPFGGAGTTGLVADRLQRDAILIELNPEYADMARKRITNDSPLFADVE